MLLQIPVDSAAAQRLPPLVSVGIAVVAASVGDDDAEATAEATAAAVAAVVEDSIDEMED